MQLKIYLVDTFYLKSYFSSCFECFSNVEIENSGCTKTVHAPRCDERGFWICMDESDLIWLPLGFVEKRLWKAAEYHQNLFAPPAILLLLSLSATLQNGLPPRRVVELNQQNFQ